MSKPIMRGSTAQTLRMNRRPIITSMVFLAWASMVVLCHLMGETIPFDSDHWLLSGGVFLGIGFGIGHLSGTWKAHNWHARIDEN